MRCCLYTLHSRTHSKKRNCFPLIQISIQSNSILLSHYFQYIFLLMLVNPVLQELNRTWFDGYQIPVRQQKAHCIPDFGRLSSLILLKSYRSTFIYLYIYLSVCGLYVHVHVYTHMNTRTRIHAHTYIPKIVTKRLVHI